jgi:hypothetical protein
MKKLILTRKQKRNLIHLFNIEFHKIFYTINKWIISCQTTVQLDTIYEFIDSKVEHINNKLRHYWFAPWLAKSISNELQNKLQTYLDESSSNYNAIREPIQEFENEVIKESKRVRIRGFENIFYEED